MLDVQSRWRQLQNTSPELGWYALVDGVQYQSHLCKRLRAGSDRFSLFAGTPDAALAHAGPWLIAASNRTDAPGATRLLE